MDLGVLVGQTLLQGATWDVGDYTVWHKLNTVVILKVQVLSEVL